MKRRFTTILFIFLFCLPISAKWEVLPETDEFKDPLNIYRLTNIAEGTYDKNKWTTGDCTLHITLEPMGNKNMRDKWDLMQIYLEVYKDDSLIPVNEDTSFQLKVKTAEKEIYSSDIIWGTNPYVLQLQGILPLLTKGHSKILMTTYDKQSYVFEFNGNNFYESLKYIEAHSIPKNTPQGNYDEWIYVEYPTFVDDFFKANYNLDVYENMSHGNWELSSRFKTGNIHLTATLSIAAQSSEEEYTIFYVVTPFTSSDDIFYFEDRKPCFADKIQFKWDGNIKTFTNEKTGYSSEFNIAKGTMRSMSKAASVEYTIYYTLDNEPHTLSGSFKGNSLEKALNSINQQQ